MDAERRFERRRFVTRHDIDDAHAAGRPVRLTGRDVLTSEAAQRARDLGVDVERESAAGWSAPGAGAGAGAAAGAGGGGPATGAADLRAAVRAAVVAELGSEVAGLDAAIDKVFRSRG